GRHTRFSRDSSSDVCSSDLDLVAEQREPAARGEVTARRGEQRAVESLVGGVVAHGVAPGRVGGDDVELPRHAEAGTRDVVDDQLDRKSVVYGERLGSAVGGS